MLNNRALAASLALFLPSFAVLAAEGDSSITKVIVYQNGGATVHRTADEAASRGDVTLTFLGLPDSITAGSVRQLVGADGSAIPFTSASVVRRAVRDSSRPEILALESKLSEHKAALKRKEFEQTRTRMQIDAIANLDISDNPDERLDYIAREVAKRQEQLLRVAPEIEGLRADIARIKRQISELSPGEKIVMDVTVKLAAPLPRTTEPTLVYETESANWWRALEARLDSQTGRATLAQRAVIRQTSGEDWPSAVIELGNSKARARGTYNDPGSRFLTLNERGERVSRRLGSSQALSMASAASVDSFAEAAVVTKGLESRILLNQDGTIPASGAEVQLPLFETDVSGAVIARVAPDGNTVPTLILEAELPSDWNTEGWQQTRLWRDGAFLGQTNWAPLKGGQMNQLPFGTLPGLEVERRDVGVVETGRAGKESERTTGTRVNYVARNGLSVPITLDIVGVVPVSGHEDIVVSVPSEATRPTMSDYAMQKGVVLWRKKLDPGQSWTVNHAYDVRYPASQILRNR